MAFLRMRKEFSECGRCSHWALCFSQCKVRSSTLYIACVSGDGVADLISLNNLRRFGRSF